MKRIQKGDKVLVITGKDRLKTGVVERVLPSKNQAVVAGVNMVKKSVKRSAKTPQGGFIDIAKGINLSNLMLLDPKTNKPTRVSFKNTGKKTQRVSKVSGSVIEGGA